MEMIAWVLFCLSGAIFTTAERIDLLQLKLPALLHKHSNVLCYMLPDKDDKHACLSTIWVYTYAYVHMPKGIVIYWFILPHKSQFLWKI